MTTVDDDCDHDWRKADDSFDHAFGTHRLEPYLECKICGATAPIPPLEP